MDTIGQFNPYKDYNPHVRIEFLKSDVEYYLAQADAYRKLAMRASDEIKKIRNTLKGDNDNGII